MRAERLGFGRTLLFLAALCLAPLASASDSKSRDSKGRESEVVEALSAEGLVHILGDLGYTGASVDEDGDVFVLIQGYSVLVLVGSYEGRYMSMVVGFSGTSATLEEINGWNRDKRFSRAYLDFEGDPILEAELDLAGGVTLARVRDFIQTYGQVSLPEFVVQVVAATSPAPAA